MTFIRGYHPLINIIRKLVVLLTKYPYLFIYTHNGDGTFQKYILLLPATLNRHNNALFECSGVSLLGLPRRYKHYANATQS